MVTPKDSNSVEDDQTFPLPEPAFGNDGAQGLRSVSSVLESSNQSSIYNALRATSSRDDDTESGQQTSNSALERVDDRMAHNVAPFLSVSRSLPRAHGGSAPHNPRLDIETIDRPPRAHIIADRLRLAPTGEVTGSSLPDHLEDFHGEDELSTTAGSSLKINLANPSSLQPSWPETLESPVSPTLPEFPAPVRSPTPPGIPSFGSEAARSYDFRIGAQHPVPNRNESLLRRLFRGTSPSPSVSQGSPPRRNRVFAEDGTAVSGNFPQRQSGHGQSVMKGASDHPFHQDNLALAQCDGGSVESNNATSEAPVRPENGSPDSYEAGEATLRWLEENIPQSDGSSPQPLVPPNTQHSTLLSGDNSGKRGDSYHTCISRAPDVNPRMGRPGRSILADPCSLASTQSAAPTNPQGTSTAGRTSQDSDPPDFWKQVMMRMKSTFCCCCGSKDITEFLNPSHSLNQNANTTTQETYITAREQRSNESQQPLPVTAARPSSEP
ncbi:hypothetical protein BDV19DRAFT_10652 [Aspergillus venezuelensis]